jgi:hypothetical protein
MNTAPIAQPIATAAIQGIKSVIGLPVSFPFLLRGGNYVISKPW